MAYLLALRLNKTHELCGSTANAMQLRDASPAQLAADAPLAAAMQARLDAIIAGAALPPSRAVLAAHVLRKLVLDAAEAVPGCADEAKAGAVEAEAARRAASKPAAEAAEPAKPSSPPAGKGKGAKGALPGTLCELVAMAERDFEVDLAPCKLQRSFPAISFLVQYGLTAHVVSLEAMNLLWLCSHCLHPICPVRRHQDRQNMKVRGMQILH